MTKAKKNFQITVGLSLNRLCCFLVNWDKWDQNVPESTILKVYWLENKKRNQKISQLRALTATMIVHMVPPGILRSVAAFWLKFQKKIQNVLRKFLYWTKSQNIVQKSIKNPAVTLWVVRKIKVSEVLLMIQFCMDFDCIWKTSPPDQCSKSNSYVQFCAEHFQAM